MKLSSAVNGKKSGPVLIFDHKLGGGANIYRDNKVKSLMDSGLDVVLIVYDYKDKYYIIRYNGRQRSVIPEKQTKYLYDFIKDIKKVQEIVINNLVSFPRPEKLLELVLARKDDWGSRLSLPLHDYYPICPSYNLLNNEYSYCGIPSVEICEKCLLTTRLEEITHKPQSIESWRADWSKLLGSADEITVFSMSSLDLLKKVYSDLDDAAINFKPHQIDYIKQVKNVSSKDGIVIGIPGNITLAKGSSIIAEMAGLIDRRKNEKIEIIVIGRLTDKYCRSSRLKITGKYRKESLSKLIESHKINIIFIPSIWPETFSFTTEEAILTGLPVAAYRIGAPAERLANYDKAVLIDDISAAEALKAIENYFRI